MQQHHCQNRTKYTTLLRNCKFRGVGLLDETRGAAVCGTVVAGSAPRALLLKSSCCVIASSIMRPAKGVLGNAADSPSDELQAPEVEVEEGVRKKRGVVWVEVADRPAKTAVPPVKILRSHSAGILVRGRQVKWVHQRM
jgi:hypothetical protein